MGACRAKWKGVQPCNSRREEGTVLSVAGTLATCEGLEHSLQRRSYREGGRVPTGRCIKAGSRRVPCKAASFAYCDAVYSLSGRKRVQAGSTHAACFNSTPPHSASALVPRHKAVRGRERDGAIHAPGGGGGGRRPSTEKLPGGRALHLADGQRPSAERFDAKTPRLLKAREQCLSLPAAVSSGRVERSSSLRGSA